MILVTGGSGFLGGYLLRYLVEEGLRVRATKRSQSDLSMVADIEDQVEWVECDLLDLPRLEEVFQGVTHVYHTAAMVSFNKSDVPWMMKTNVDSTKNIVNCSLKYGIEKLIFSSSIAALGRRTSKETINEQAVWERSKHNSNYGISKFRSEREVWRGIAEGLHAAIVNPSVIMGAGKWDEGTPQMFKTVYHGLPAVPNGITGYVDVRDVARAMIMLMNSNIADERFVLNAESLTYSQLFTMIANAVGKNPPKYKVSRRQGLLIAYLDKFRAMLTNSSPKIQLEYARNFSKYYHYENDKIREVLGLNFTPIQQTIEETGAVFLEQYLNGNPGMLSLKELKNN